MLHTLHEHKNTKEEEIKERFRLGGPNELYFGKGNKVIGQYNRRRNILARIRDNDEKFRKTKHKIKLVVYKNGFILNNCPFRDRSLPENNDFLESVERGNIPQEFIRKGIKDLGILLINRKEEMFRSSRLYQSLPTSFDYLDLSKNRYQRQTYKQEFGKIHPIDAFAKSQVNIFNERDNQLYSSRTERIPNRLKEIICHSSSQENMGFVPFTGRGTLLATANIEGTLINCEKPKHGKEMNKPKEDVNRVDPSKPICEVNLMLYTGEFIKGQFNYTQTVRDIYNYVRGKSKIKDFILFDPFSSATYLDFDRTVEQLKLGETVLAQKKR